MLLLKTDALPDDGERWAYQLKVDGYRAIAFKTGGAAAAPLAQRSTTSPCGTRRCSRAWPELPNDTVVDGELVAFDAEGRPSFGALQNYGPSADAARASTSSTC